MGSLFVRPLSWATVSANESAIALVSNANVDEPGLVWRSDDLTSVYVIIDLGTAASYDTVALIGTNLRTTDRVQVRTSVADTGIGAYGATVQAYTGTLPLGSTAKSIIKLPDARTERYIRIDITSTDNPDGYVSAQRIVVGKALSLRNGAGVNLGHEISFVDQSTASTGPGWTSYDEWQVLKKMKLTVSFLPDSDFDEWYGFMQAVGKKRAFLCVPNDTQPDKWQAEAIFGRLTQDSQATGTVFNARRFDLEITSTAQ